ncbi:MAG: hypothetical protein CL908_19465 [Deltaproteobacteria bacterium]|jgi:AcrR family transcriptional regulator|nr:hypothetical protein [Deltaproteobacteria bacterium]
MSAVARKTRASSDGGRLGEPRKRPLTRRRGRPARLSREHIIDAVFTLLEREPGAGLTISRIAREVEASPAALYRHFESLDDLLDSVLARVFAHADADPDVREAWEDQLDAWMRGLRAQLLRVPAVIALIGRSGRTSPVWLEASSVLVEILERAGLVGRPLAMTYLWILETTTGLVLQEAILPVSDQLANARVSRHELGDVARVRFAAIHSELDRIDGDDFFSFGVEQVRALVALRRQTTRRG